MRRAALSVLAVALLLAAGCEQPGSTSRSAGSASPHMPAGYGILVGGIETECSPPWRMAYKAGNVFVLRGRFTDIGSWIPKSRVQGIPSVASQLVPAGGHYSFLLLAGRYVLIDDDGGSRTSNGSGATVSYVPWTNALVEAGQTNSWDIPPDPTACPCCPALNGAPPGHEISRYGDAKVVGAQEPTMWRITTG
jgi:hypothetical protein